MWNFLVCLPLLFFPPVSYSAVPLQSIDCFCSSRRLIASLLARFALVRRRYCSCSSSRPFRFSPSIVSALLVARSASVRRLFHLFSSINSFFSRQFRSSLSIVSALLVTRSASVRRMFLLDLLVARSASVRHLFMLFSSINHFSSRHFRSSPSIKFCSSHEWIWAELDGKCRVNIVSV